MDSSVGPTDVLSPEHWACSDFEPCSEEIRIVEPGVFEYSRAQECCSISDSRPLHLLEPVSSEGWGGLKDSRQHKREGKEKERKGEEGDAGTPDRAVLVLGQSRCEGTRHLLARAAMQCQLAKTLASCPLPVPAAASTRWAAVGAIPAEAESPAEQRLARKWTALPDIAEEQMEKTSLSAITTCSSCSIGTQGRVDLGTASTDEPEEKGDPGVVPFVAGPHRLCTQTQGQVLSAGHSPHALGCTDAPLLPASASTRDSSRCETATAGEEAESGEAGESRGQDENGDGEDPWSPGRKQDPGAPGAGSRGTLSHVQHSITALLPSNSAPSATQLPTVAFYDLMHGSTSTLIRPSKPLCGGRSSSLLPCSHAHESTSSPCRASRMRSLAKPRTESTLISHSTPSPSIRTKRP